MKPSKVLLSVAVGAAALAMGAMNASAAVACRGNVCWHVHEHYHYPSSARVVIHPDGWRWGPRVVIRDHEGRGYWHGGHWVEFH